MRANNDDTVFRILQDEIPGLTRDDMASPFDQLNIDSFGFISLRARLEQLAGYEIGDEIWTAAKCPSDIFKMISAGEVSQNIETFSKIGFRSFNINMPQMAMSGLSESWLFKELGDMHWNMITDGLGSPSSGLLDGNGNRLYATFTRISISINPFSSYKENSQLSLCASSFARFGAGMFFSEIDISPGSGHAQLMSSFTSRGEKGSNLSLQKGQPLIPPGCKIPKLENYPVFADGYRARRGNIPAEVIFEYEYEIVPQHDINGVGLLYFAAYPVISEICLAKYKDQRHLSTSKKDVFYFGNCDENETLVFRLHKHAENPESVESEMSISRKGDGVLMAYLITTKQVVK